VVVSAASRGAATVVEASDAEVAVSELWARVVVSSAQAMAGRSDEMTRTPVSVAAVLNILL
jgi:hypothetical protein